MSTLWLALFFQTNISTTVRWIAIQFCADIHNPHWQKPTDAKWSSGFSYSATREVTRHRKLLVGFLWLELIFYKYLNGWIRLTFNSQLLPHRYASMTVVMFHIYAVLAICAKKLFLMKKCHTCQIGMDIVWATIYWFNFAGKSLTLFKLFNNWNHFFFFEFHIFGVTYEKASSKKDTIPVV